MIKKIFIFLFILIIVSINSQNYHLKLYNINNGLNANLINDYTIDTNDNIWLATNFGLKKFDGYNFIDIKTPFNNKEINKIFYINNCIYILFENGDFIIYNLKFDSFNKANKDKILDFYVDSEVLILLKSNYNIEIIKNNKKINYKLKFNEKIPTQSFLSLNSIIFYKNSVYFSIPKTGIYKMNKNKITDLSKRNNIIPSGYRDRFKIIDNKLFYLGFDNPLVISSNNKIEKLVTNEKKTISINEISYFDQDFFYLIDNNTLKIKTKKNQFVILNELKNVELRKVFKLGTQIYITSNKGLYELTPKTNIITNTTLDDKILVKRKIIEEKDRILFFGNPNIISLQKGKLFKLNKLNESIYDVIRVKDSYYLATEGKGVLKANLDFSNLKQIEKNSKLNITSIFYDEKDNLIYYGNDEFLFCFNPKLRIITKINNPYKGFLTKGIIRDYGSEKIFVGTDNGLFIFDTKTKKTSKFLQNKIIGDILIDKKNKILWVGHDNGIIGYSILNLKIIKKIKFDFLKNPKVASIVIDDFNRIWISTFSGIVVYDYKLNMFVKIQNSNLISWEYNYKSSCKLKNGKLIFGGLDGYDVIDSKKINFYKKPLNGKVSGYYIFRKKTNQYFSTLQNNEIKLSVYDSFLRIFISVDKRIKKQYCTFQYRLNNSSWIDVKKQQIDLIGLAKGKYFLEVRGFDEIGNVIEFSPIHIRVKENFFKSNIFIFGLVICLLFLLMYNLKIRNNKLRLKNEIYEKISMDLHDEIGTILSKTSLLIANGNLNEKRWKDKILDNIKHANFGLRTYINTLNEIDNQLIDLYYDCIELLDSSIKIKGIKYTYSFVGNKKKAIKENIYRDLRLCLYEIFNNAIKHSKSNQIDIKFIENNGDFTIDIIEKNNYIDLNKIILGNGLVNIEKRIKRNNGVINFYSDKNLNQFLININIKI